MQLELCWIGKTKELAIDALTREYIQRIRRYLPVETCALRDEAALMKRIEAERPRPQLILLDARGRQFTSEEFADFLRTHQGRATRKLVFAIGPADGWSEEVRAGGQLLSLGKMTLAHELARVVVLEQLYRALTIIAGHPYHLGHSG